VRRHDGNVKIRRDRLGNAGGDEIWFRTVMLGQNEYTPAPRLSH
jgi:hypothetical protein